MNVAWSRIQNTKLAEAAVGHITNNMYEDHTDMDTGVVLHYHNLLHVQSMYQYLEKANEPYDEVLDWAVLFHDVIYDAKPSKELRSGLYFIKQAQALGCTLTEDEQHRVVKLILETEYHTNLESPIVRADLHQLADSVQVFRNFNSIMEESMALHNINERTFAEKSEEFMRGLADRINMNLYLDNKNKRLWDNIYQGVLATIDLARIVQGEAT